MCKGIIKYVSHFVGYEKLKDIINNICLLFNLRREYQETLAQYVDKKQKEEEIDGLNYVETLFDDENYRKKKSKKHASDWKNEVDKIVIGLIKKTKIPFLKYQVYKATELYKLLNYIYDKKKKKKINVYKITSTHMYKHIYICIYIFFLFIFFPFK